MTAPVVRRSWRSRAGRARRGDETVVEGVEAEREDRRREERDVERQPDGQRILHERKVREEGEGEADGVLPAVDDQARAEREHEADRRHQRGEADPEPPPVAHGEVQEECQERQPEVAAVLVEVGQAPDEVGAGRRQAVGGDQQRGGGQDRAEEIGVVHLDRALRRPEVVPRAAREQEERVGDAGEEHDGGDAEPAERVQGAARHGAWPEEHEEHAGDRGHERGGPEDLSRDVELRHHQRSEHQALSHEPPVPAGHDLVQGVEDEWWQGDEREVHVDRALADHVRREAVEEPAGEGGRGPACPAAQHEVHREGRQGERQPAQQVLARDRAHGEGERGGEETEERYPGVLGEIGAERHVDQVRQERVLAVEDRVGQPGEEPDGLRRVLVATARAGPDSGRVAGPGRIVRQETEHRVGKECRDRRMAPERAEPRARRAGRHDRLGSPLRPRQDRVGRGSGRAHQAGRLVTRGSRPSRRAGATSRASSAGDARSSRTLPVQVGRPSILLDS